MLAADLALVSAVAGLAWEFREDLGSINAADWMLLIGLGCLAHLALAVYLPGILIQSSSLKAWWLSAGPLVLGWLIQQRLEQVHFAHAIKVIDAHWKNVPLQAGVSGAWGLDEVQSRARAHAREKHLSQTLAVPETVVPSSRPRL